MSNIDNRLKVISDFESFFEEKRKVLETVISDLGWNKDSIQNESKVQCPFDAGHWVPEGHLKKHTKLCAWLKDDHSKEDMEKEPSSSHFFYENSSSVVPFKIDKVTLGSLLKEKGFPSFSKRSEDESRDIPKTADRLCVEFNREERLAMYDHIIEQNKSTNQNKKLKLEDLMVNFENKEEENKPKTDLELLAEQRDYKRRRQSYRAKNVHITKKSYTEIMKEVIENQISYLEDVRKQENNESTSKEDSERSSKKRSRGDSSEEYYKHSSHHRSNRRESRSPTPKRHKKHKHSDRDRSGSRSRKHKKHHKHKKSHKSSRKDEKAESICSS